MVDMPDVRAGDEDRDRTITLIRDAYAEGRLDNDEFQSRMASAQQARTFGDLAALVNDLPVQPPSPSIVAVPSPSTVVPTDEDEEQARNLRKGWAAWAGVSVMVNVIWLGTWVTSGSAPPYWPIWVMGPWGAAMLIGTLTRRAR
jgi:hypothetical protein